MGKIEYRPGMRRAIIIKDMKDDLIEDITSESAQLSTEHNNVVKLPCIGKITAGIPILAHENYSDEEIVVSKSLIGNDEAFILKVKGDSMINVGIFNGDNIFVESCNVAKNGDIVVALVDDNATVKTFYKENGHVRLQPENDTMEPIIVEDCQILGKVFGVFRLCKQY